MKVSLNWVREYLDFELPATSELVEKIGAQLGAVEEVVELGPKYQGVVIVTVVSCEKIENSDHLNVCLVDDGQVVTDVERNSDGLVQVVCGAPNVAAGVMVAWLPPGSTVPASFDDAEPFVLSARPLRGVVSNGMLASAKELAIGDNHEGLLLLDDDAKPGDSFAKTYKLDDTIIDIENKMFTHRPDCFGQLGIAREIAGILGHTFRSPQAYLTPQNFGIEAVTDLLEVRNEVPELVPRFVAQVFQNVAVKASPIWLQSYLSRVGVRPINNVVDITNYCMLLTGQPLHAYDYDKVKALDAGADKATLVVRMPHDGEKITLLNGKTVEPRSQAIMIATTTQAIGIGGVMGGQDTEVDADTKNIILECATFDMYSIRRTSMAQGLFTDAVTRFNKGQSPLQNDRIVAMATQQLCGAQAAVSIDLNQLPTATTDRQSLFLAVEIEASFINSRLGLALTAEAMADLLRKVEFKVDVIDEKLTVSAPFWRTDIELREDVVEEIGRLYGFDSMPLVLPTRSIQPATKNPLLELKQRVRESLSKAGANEVLTYSFVHGNLLDSVTQNREQAFKLSNALSPDLQYYRLHALPSLLDKVHANSKAGYDSFALFELNKGHNLLHKDDDNGVPTEMEFLDFVYAASKSTSGAAFYTARAYLDQLAKDFGLHLSYKKIDEDPHVPVADPYDYTRSAYVSVVETGDFLGMVGEFKSVIARKLKLPPYVAGFTIGLSQLRDAAEKAPQTYAALPRFPKIEQDICLKVAADMSYQTLLDFIQTQLTEHKPEHSRLSVSLVDIFQRPDDAEHKQSTLRISLASYERTLTDAEISALLDNLAVAAQKTLSAERV